MQLPEPPVDFSEVRLTTGSSGLPPLCLYRPVILSDALFRITASCAYLLLDVEGAGTTPDAQGVGLVVPFTKATGTLRLETNKLWFPLVWWIIKDSGFIFLWEHHVFQTMHARPLINTTPLTFKANYKYERKSFTISWGYNLPAFCRLHIGI